MNKIKGVKNWYCSLEMKKKFGTRPLAAASRSIHVQGVQAHANMQTCRHKKDKKSEAKKSYPKFGTRPLAAASRSIHVLGVQAHANMQTCRHKKDQKSEAKKITQSWV